MERILLKQGFGEKSIRTQEAEAELEQVVRYFSELRLLKGVPFSYLIPDEILLPPESIRFFQIDENWLDALTNGAMSVGRTGRAEASMDAEYLETAGAEATRQLGRVRFERMHRNHRKTKRAALVTSEARAGFLLRSELVGKWKALEVFGYQEKRQLSILRMESLTSEILLCIFDGIPDKLVISEPKTGLRFGAPDHTGVIALRNIEDTEEFGTLLEANVDLNTHTDENGRLHVSHLAEELQKKLGDTVNSSQLAFELIAVARRAEFYRGGE